MRPHADRVGQHGQVIAKAVGEGARQKFELGCPTFVVARRFEVQIEQPTPAVGTLEPASHRPLEKGDLAGDLLKGEAVISQLRDRISLGDLWKQPSDCQQRPPAVNAAMPVEASVEDRVKDTRRREILVCSQHLVQLVRIFLAHVAERDPRQVGGKVGVESGHRRNPAM